MKGVGQQASSPQFTGVDFFDTLGREPLLRAAILCVLYDRRLTDPSRPSLSIRHLELIVEAPVVRLNSALWYLKQRGLAASDDKSSLQITVDGMDFLESKRPLPEQVMPFIKPAAIAVSQARPQPARPLQTPVSYTHLDVYKRQDFSEYRDRTEAARRPSGGVSLTRFSRKSATLSPRGGSAG